MKSKHYTLLLLLTIIISCTKEKSTNKFTINGTIKGDVPAYLLLEYGKVKDCVLVKNNKFSATGFVKNPTQAYLTISPTSSMIDDWFYIENEEITIELTVEKKTMNNFEINFIKIDTLRGTNTALIKVDFEKFKNLNSNKPNWNALLLDKLIKLADEYPTHNYIGFLLIKNIENKNLNKQQVELLFKKIDSKAFSNRQLETINNIIKPESSVGIGKNISDFELPNSENNKISTKNFRGKVFLIDFWASWCTPCRKFNPELLKVYEEYNSKGFEILGVSLDTDIEKWKKAVKQDKLIWENVIDTEAFNGEIAAKYHVTAIPINYLINQEGEVIAAHVDINNLKVQLNKIFIKK